MAGMRRKKMGKLKTRPREGDWTEAVTLRFRMILFDIQTMYCITFSHCKSTQQSFLIFTSKLKPKVLRIPSMRIGTLCWYLVAMEPGLEDCLELTVPRLIDQLGDLFTLRSFVQQKEHRAIAKGKVLLETRGSVIESRFD
jgi:hypothetical protein